MFIGEYNYSVDDKGRIAVPAKFRRELGSEVIVARGVDSCLSLYTKAEWKKLAEKWSNLPIGQANSRAFSRHMLAGAMDTKIDSQGRIMLADYLKEYAGINKKAVIIGLYNRLEIWEEDKWKKYKTQTEKDSNDIAEKLGELGV